MFSLPMLLAFAAPPITEARTERRDPDPEPEPFDPNTLDYGADPLPDWKPPRLLAAEAKRQRRADRRKGER